MFTKLSRSGWSSGDIPHVVACILTPMENIYEFRAILEIKGDSDAPPEYQHPLVRAP